MTYALWVGALNQLKKKKKSVCFPKNSNYSTSTNSSHGSSNDDTCHYARPCTKSYFLSSYYVLSLVLVTQVSRMGMTPGDLTLQLGEAREHTCKLIKKKPNFHIEKKSLMTIAL